ncbi:MAG: hypothetical protein BWY31_02317 [Lentisphaerae bacterium ADurb.Bin242]|nr:MAG: hypothetical protein BWY31_02317 [Lentisphaerae bacterium ADurb.Bin242]
MKIHSIFPSVAVALTAVFLMGASSCEKFMENPEKYITEESDKTPRYVITIHDIVKYKRADILEMDVDSFFGGTVCINKNARLHSRDIMKVELVPRPNNREFFDLKLTLSPRGQKIWSTFAISNADSDKLAFLIDGMYYRSFTPVFLTEPEVKDVVLQGPFDPATAKGITINAERNYKIYNNQ